MTEEREADESQSHSSSVSEVCLPAVALSAKQLRSSL